MNEVIKPTTYEIRNWLLGTLQHSCLVEYYLYALGLGYNDPQRPHDLTGLGNKFSWSVIKGLAIQYRSVDPIFFKTYVLPSILVHRKHQYHHQKWNGDEKSSDVDSEDMKVGAVDAICSLLGCRPYQGGSHTFEQIAEIIKQNPEDRIPVYKIKWFWMLHDDMKKLSLPNWRAVNSLVGIPNIGLSEDVYDRIVAIVKKTVYRLRTKYGYHDL